MKDKGAPSVTYAERPSNATDAAGGVGEGSLMATPVPLSPWVALKGALNCKSFPEFMDHVRHAQGDAVSLNLWPVLPMIYVLQGKVANRLVLDKLDPNLEQILQELINFLPVSARVPSEVDVDLQVKVAQLFSSVSVVNERLPSFQRVAEQMRDRWVGAASAQSHGGTLDPTSAIDVFFELSEYVLRADLEILYGSRFTERNAPQLVARLNDWVRNIANGQLVGFFSELGELLKEAIRDVQASPEAYEGERSVLQVYLNSGALERQDEEAIVGLLSMTLMAAVFNTQVSLAWILVHLYSDPELLARARAEIAACPDLGNYAKLLDLEFLNSCIDESVRMHTMLPGNVVLRKTLRDLQLGEATVKEGSILWLYPNAIHRDDKHFAEADKFCPYRLLKGNLQKKQNNYELVTFGLGNKRCIGEKMARATICAFLATVLPAVDADAPTKLPVEGFFDLIPASELRLHNLRKRDGAMS